MRDEREKRTGRADMKRKLDLPANGLVWENSEDSDETEPASGHFPFGRVLVFLVLLVALGGLLLLAVTGMDPAAIRTQGWPAFWDQVTGSFREEPVRELVLAEFPVEVPEPAMAVQGENVVLCTGGELRALDEEGVERWIRPVQLNAPHLSVEGRDVLYADLSGRTFGIVRDGSSFFEKQSPHPLYNVHLSRDYVLLLQRAESTGYSAILDAYSHEGGAVFTSYITDYTPFLIRQAPETGQEAIVLSGLSAQLMTAGGAVEFVAPDTSRRGGLSSETDLYTVILQLTNGTTALVGETSMRLVDRDLLSVGEYAPEGNSITAAALLDGQYPVLAVLDAKRYETTRQEKTWLRILDATGTMKKEIVQDGRVVRLVTSPDCIAVMTENRVVFLDGDGNELTSYDAKETVRNVVLTEKGKAYLLADGLLTRIQVRERKRFLGLF